MQNGIGFGAIGANEKATQQRLTLTATLRLAEMQKTKPTAVEDQDAKENAVNMERNEGE